MTNKIEMNMEQLERVSGGVSIIINSHTGPNGEILFDGSVTNTGEAPTPFHNIDYDTVHKRIEKAKEKSLLFLKNELELLEE